MEGHARALQRALEQFRARQVPHCRGGIIHPGNIASKVGSSAPRSAD
jgi:hypothetical protein